MSLSLYKKKRDFKKTPEPKESGHSKNGNLSFVIQKHDASHLHYDFRLEMNGVLKSWAVPKGPSMDPSDKRLAVMVEDHPLKYGKFYGIIPEGNYGAGTVEIWDKGTYIPMLMEGRENPEKLLNSELEKGDLKIVLDGHFLKGAFALVRMKSENGKNWLLIKKKDKYAIKNYDIRKIAPVKLFKEKNESFNTAGNLNEENIKKDKFKKTGIESSWKKLRKPMLAKLTDNSFFNEVNNNNKDWIFEIKYDGYRMITKADNGKVEMLSRNGNRFNKVYEPVLKDLERIQDSVILDGEIIIENNKGIPEFQLLQNYNKSGKGILKYYVFDIIFLNGHDLSNLPLLNRKELLDEFFKKYKFNEIYPSAYFDSNGRKFFEKISKKGYEGIIAKEKNSLYFPGKRSSSWLKIKSALEQEVVIGGYTSPQGSRKYFGSLILGIYENRKLRYTGNCGSGFTEASLKELYEDLKPLETKTIPFDPEPVLTGVKGKPVWVKPELICNVKFSEWTNDRQMRHPVFKGLRSDKSPKKVIMEIQENKSYINLKNNIMTADNILTINKKNVKITHPDKLYWKKEKISKGELIKYYIDVSKYILPYLKNRPESLNRHPNGINAAGFYQKDMDIKQIPDWLKTEKIYSSSANKYIDYLICNDTATLVYMANLGCIEINPWNSVFNKPNKPDYMIIDLDPGKIDFKEVVRTALVIKKISDKIGAECYCKTSGATGLHIYYPLNGRYEYVKVRDFAKKLSEKVKTKLPDITSTERSVSKRKNKIYLDYLQNSKGQTVAAPYSVRPKPGATVSTPLKWSEVKSGLSPSDFTIFNTIKRLKRTGDLWKGVLGKSIPLAKVSKKLEELES